MTPIESESENFSDKFFKTIFDDKNDIDYDVTIMVGDFNVAPDQNKDILGYFPINNPNTRWFIERMKSLNMLTDIYRHSTLSIKSKCAIILVPVLITFLLMLIL